MTSNTQQQPTLGEYLKREREKSGLTLEQVASATKISVQTLRHIEADEYRDLPAKPFVRGFIISYARFVGLDPKEILTRYQGFIDQKIQERPSRDSGHSGYAFEKRDSDHSRKILVITLSSFLVLGLLLVVLVKPQGRKKHSRHIETLRTLPVPTAAENARTVGPTSAPTPTHTPAHTSAPSPSPTVKPVAAAVPGPTPSLPVPTPAAATTGPTPAPDPLDSGINLKPEEIREKVIFKAKRDLWIRYQADDRPVRRIILRAGNVLVLRGAKSIRAELSDKTAAQVNHNGRVIHDPEPRADGDPVEPKGFTFPDQKIPGSPFASEPPLPREAPPPKPAPTKTP